MKDDQVLYFDWLNEGSCFCVYSAFNQEMTQHVNFRATSGCIIDTLSIKSLKKLEKEYLQISDCLNFLELEIKRGKKTHLDFFRFLPERGGNFTENTKRLLRRKFRASVINILMKKRRGELVPLPALDAVRDYILIK